MLLGIDNGGTVAKAALFTPDGRELAVASRKVELLSPHPGWSEIDARQLWRATAQAIREVIARAGIGASQITAIAPTGFGNGLFLVDRAGDPVRNAIASSDSRARAYIERWLAEGRDTAMRPLTMQGIWPAQPNALLNWMRDHEPRSLKSASHYLCCKDYIRMRLTGRANLESTDLSGTSLMDVGRGRYSEEVLAGWGLTDLFELFPPMIESAEIAGTVTSAAADQTGLAPGTPVAGGMFDIDACGLGSGMVDESSLCMIVGTWGNNQYVSRTPVVSQDVFMTTRYSIPGWFLILEGSATSAANLEWFAREFFDAEQQQAGQSGRSVFDLVSQQVASVHPRDSGAVFLPFLYGSNVSLDGKACLFGFDGWQKRAHVLRAIYEGVVFAHRWHVQRLLKFRAMPRAIRLSGGAARSAVWSQIFADIFQVPVEIPDGSELGALGAAIGASVAIGIHKTWPDAVRSMVRLARTHQPDSSLAGVYEAKYQRYLQLLSALAPAWGPLAWRLAE